MRLSFQTVQLSPGFGAGVSLTEALDAAADAGFTRVGLDVWSVEAHERDGGKAADLPVILADRGLACTDVLPLVVTMDHRHTLDAAGRLAALASATGATVCGVAFGPDVTDPADRGVRDVVRRCAEILAGGGLRMAVEFVPYSAVRTLSQACELCDEIGWDRAGILLDSWHTLVTGQLDELRHLVPGAVAMVQFSDAMVPLRRDLRDESRNHRLLPGQGNLNLSGFVAALTRLGYGGVLSPEVLSNRVRSGSPVRFAHDLRRTTAAYVHVDGRSPSCPT